MLLLFNTFHCWSWTDICLFLNKFFASCAPCRHLPLSVFSFFVQWQAYMWLWVWQIALVLTPPSGGGVSLEVLNICVRKTQNVIKKTTLSIWYKLGVGSCLKNIQTFDWFDFVIFHWVLQNQNQLYWQSLCMSNREFDSGCYWSKTKKEKNIVVVYK